MVVQLLVQMHPMHPPGYRPGNRITSVGRYPCHLGRRTSIAWALRYSITRRTLLVPSREENIKSLGAAVQHDFRRALLLPSTREENVNSLVAAVQHNFRRTLLVPSREDNINSLGAAVQRN